MNSRERVMAVLWGERPDRIPTSVAFYPTTLEPLGNEDPEEHFGTDVRFARFPLPPAHDEFLGYLESLPADVHVGSKDILRTYFDWGYRPEVAGFRAWGDSDRIEELAERLAASPPRHLVTDSARSGLAKEIAEYHERGLAVVGSPPHLGGELFETAWRMRGFERFLMDLVENPELVHYLLDQLAAMHIATSVLLTEAGVDVLALDDDIGEPTRMLFSPEHWRAYFKPRWAAIIRACRAVNPRLGIFYHSDGCCEPIIPDLIELGVNVLHPVQPDVMDPADLKRRFGDRLAFWGTVGTAQRWAWSDPESIRAEVRERIQTVGKDGGLIISPAYDLEPEVRWENVEAFFAAAAEYGSYE